jgi:hypothetical protein
MAGVDDLLDLNRFLAGLQAKPAGWAAQMRGLLTLGFVRRPWKADTAQQSADDLIDGIERGPAVEVSVSWEHGWLHGNLGAVASTCTYADLSDADLQVIRVFTHRTDRWQCDYWQETLCARTSE